MMPEMDGESLIRAIRADTDPIVASTPAVLLSSSGQKGDAKTYAEMGFSGYLSKPIQAAPLRQVLSTVLGMHGAVVKVEDLVTRHLVEEIEDQRRGLVTQLRGRILLAEDVPANQKVALLMLKRFGIEADIADNGREAVARWRQGGYDLVLMDCQMPDMDGYEATREIRRQERNSRIPIIALTANALADDRQKCLDCGMDDFLSKPFKVQELGDTLSRWLPIAKVTAEGAEATNDVKLAPDLATTSLDRATLDQMREDYGDDFDELLEVFIETTPTLIADLRLAVAKGDIAEIHHHAHGLKSSCASFGANHLSLLCQQLEAQARSGEPLDAPGQLAAIEEEYTRVAEQLARYKAAT